MASPDPMLSTLGLLALASDPTGSVVGESYWSTSLNCIRTYDGSQWVGGGASGGDPAFALFLA